MAAGPQGDLDAEEAGQLFDVEDDDALDDPAALDAAFTTAIEGEGIDAFSVRLREEVDLDSLSAELLAVLDQTMQPTTASLWLRPSAGQPGRTGT